MPSKQTREGYWKKYYANNREAILAKQKEYASSEKARVLARERYKKNQAEILRKRKEHFDTDKERLAAKKAAYDKEYRLKNKEKISQRDKDYYNKNKSNIEIRSKEYRSRPENKKRHREYLNTPQYKQYKHKYDVKRWHTEEYGEFWECTIIIHKIKKKVVEIVPSHLDRIKMRGQYTKGIKRAAKRRHLMYGWNYNY